MQSRAPEYSGSQDLPPPTQQSLSAISGEPTTAPAPPASAAAAPSVAVPRLPGTPDLKEGLYVFAGAGIELTVDPLSGYVVHLTLDGQNALLAPEPHIDNYYGAELEGSALVLKSTDGNLVKRFRLDTARRSLEITYAVTNTSPRPARIGASDFHRVASAGGLTFFSGTQLAGGTLKLNVLQSVAWFVHDQNKAATLVEARADGLEGWIATVNDGLLLVKTIGDANKPTIAIAAPYDAASKQHPFVEITEQGPLPELAPGASTTMNVRIFLRKLPPAIVAKPGNQELVGFVRGVIQ